VELARLFAQVVFATVALTFVAALAVRAIRFAKRGTPGAQALGDAFLLASFGYFGDQTREMVEEAKDLEREEEDDSGDPPNEDDRRRQPRRS
jgi:hypothetical protein